MNKLIGVLFILALLIGNSSALIISSVSTTPQEIAPGEVSIVEIGVENNGEEDINDVSVSLNLKDIPFAPYLSSSEFNFDEIKNGKTRFADFKIRALSNAQSGIYKMPVSISYSEEGETKERDSLISIAINSQPIIDAQVEEGLLLKGTENTLAVRMVNKGLSDIKFLEIDLEKGSDYSALSPEKVYIGDLDSDDFDSAEFKINIKENSPTNLKIPVTIRYKDSLNKEYEEKINLDAKVYSKEQAIQLGLIQQNNTFIYIVIAVVLIIAYLIYRRVRKRIKRKKEKEG